MVKTLAYTEAQKLQNKSRENGVRLAQIVSYSFLIYSATKILTNYSSLYFFTKS